MADSEFQRPTLAENISMIRADLFARLDINDELRRMDEDVRARVYAGALHTVYGYIDYLAMNMLPDLCDESWLYRHAAMKRCPRKEAVADTIAGGFDIEDLEVWRARVLERYYWTPQGGADGDYVVWAKEVPGVTRAWTYRHWMGTGTVGVMIASSDLINPILDDTTVAAAQDHIEPLAPVAGSDLYVFKATPKIIDFTIDLNPDNETTRAAVKAELLSFLLRDGYPEGTLELSRINEAISIAAGERSHTLISPAVDTPIAKNELAVMGDIVWA